MVTPDNRLSRKMTGYLTRDRLAIVAAFAFPLAAAAILVPWRASWADTDVALLLVVVVVAVAAIGNGLAGALAAIWAAIWFDFFFTVPYGRLTIRTSSDVTTFAVLFVVGIAVSQLAARARRLKVVAITDAGYLAQIQETASLAQGQRLRMWSSSRSGSSSSACSICRIAVLSTGCRSIIRRGWTKMALSGRNTACGRLRGMRCKARRLSCVRSATASTTGGS